MKYLCALIYFLVTLIVEARDEVFTPPEHYNGLHSSHINWDKVAPDEEHQVTYTEILWIAARYKGLMSGISEGFYDNPSTLVDEDCLNQDAITAIDNIIEGFNHGDGGFERGMRIFTAATSFIVNIQGNCNMHAFIYDSISYCFFTNQCGGWNATINISNNLKPIAVSIFDLAQVSINMWSPDTIDDMFEKYRRIGVAFGTIMIMYMDLDVKNEYLSE